MRRLGATALIVIVAMTLTLAGQATRAEMALEAARRVEVVDGDLQGAIKLYRAVVASYEDSDRPAAAMALVRMGACYQRLGNQQAGPIFNRVIRDFGDQPAAVTEARRALATLTAQATSEPDGLVCPQCGDSGAAMSPDGRWMVVHHWDSGDLARVDLGTLETTRLNIKTGDWSTHYDEARFPALSPDGRFLAYTWHDDGAAERGEPPLVIRVRDLQAGGSARTVFADSSVAPLPLAWSSDGQSILAELVRDTGRDLAWVSAGDGAVTVIKPIGNRLWTQRASVSPDGRFIAYSAIPPDVFLPARRGPSQEHLYVIPALGGPEEAVVANASLNRTAVWSPDGSKLLYMSNVSGTWDLWTVAVGDGRATAAPALVRKSIGDSFALGVTPSGRLHYYQGHAGIMQSLIVPVGSPAAVPVDLIGSKPTWSPDGASVALVRRRPPDANEIDIVVKNVASGAERVYSHDGMLGFPMLWFRDGGLLNVIMEGERQYLVPHRPCERRVPQARGAARQSCLRNALQRQDALARRPDAVLRHLCP